jgi:hypothetical protein
MPRKPRDGLFLHLPGKDMKKTPKKPIVMAQLLMALLLGAERDDNSLAISI